MLSENPELIQLGDWPVLAPGSPAAPRLPVFLIHDGGGTTFAYHCLDPLHRLVYGIHNPYFYDGGRFAGGLPAMGRLYAKHVRETVAQADLAAPRGPDGRANILLGGWSLGGLLSLEVAKVLVDDDQVRVVGILMVDSVYPAPGSRLERDAVALETAEEGKSKSQVLAQRCMAEARRMAAHWQVPLWDGLAMGKRPKIILLRAEEHIPTNGLGTSTLDWQREDSMLGWGNHDETMFEAVMDVEGHHFDLFEQQRIPMTTAMIRSGLEMLDGMAVAPSRGTVSPMDALDG